MFRYFNKSKIIYIILFVLFFLILFLIYLNYINVELIDNLLELKDNKDINIKNYITYLDYYHPFFEYLIYPLYLLFDINCILENVKNEYHEADESMFSLIIINYLHIMLNIFIENFFDNNLIKEDEEYIKIRSYKYNIDIIFNFIYFYILYFFIF